MALGILYHKIPIYPIFYLPKEDYKFKSLRVSLPLSRPRQGSGLGGGATGGLGFRACGGYIGDHGK